VITSRVLVVVLAFMVCLSAIGYMAFPSPQRRQSGVTIKLPHRNPANDASGIAGWVWPDGVPGWTPGQTIKGFPVSFMQPVEIQAAQLAAELGGSLDWLAGRPAQTSPAADPRLRFSPERFRALRDRSPVAPGALAAASGLTIGRSRRLLTGTFEPTLATVVTLASLLGVAAADLCEVN